MRGRCRRDKARPGMFARCVFALLGLVTIAFSAAPILCFPTWWLVYAFAIVFVPCGLVMIVLALRGRAKDKPELDRAAECFVEHAGQAIVDILSNT